MECCCISYRNQSTDDAGTSCENCMSLCQCFSLQLPSSLELPLLDSRLPVSSHMLKINQKQQQKLGPGRKSAAGEQYISSFKHYGKFWWIMLRWGLTTKTQAVIAGSLAPSVTYVYSMCTIQVKKNWMVGSVFPNMKLKNIQWILRFMSTYSIHTNQEVIISPLGMSLHVVCLQLKRSGVTSQQCCTLPNSHTYCTQVCHSYGRVVPLNLCCWGASWTQTQAWPSFVGSNISISFEVAYASLE